MTPSRADLKAQAPEAEPVGAQVPALAASQGPQAVLALQRSSGNQAVSRYLARERGLISTGELTSRFNQARAAHPLHPRRPDVHFRVPSAAEIKSMLASGDVPESRIKESIATALGRMQHDKRLKTTDAIPDIMLKLFPAPGVFDEAEFAKVVDVSSRSRVYEKASDAESQLAPADKLKVLTAMGQAEILIDAAIGDSENLKRVFGTKASVAKTNYGNAKAALAKLKTDIDTKVHTDYNLDDPEVGLGGWARFSAQMVHLKPGIAKGLDPAASAITIVHECAHLSDATVKDKGYYPASAANSAGWEALTDDQKVTNAAHYEEIPRRILGKSVFKDDEEFKPGISSGGGAVTFETKVRRLSSEYLRMAWDAAVDTHMGLRRIKVEVDKGNAAAFTAKEARIVEISKLAKLTIHDQTPKPKKINTLDLTLSEGVAHATVALRRLEPAQTVPAAPVPPKTEQDYADEVVANAIAAYGKLTGNAADDKKLLDWLVANYKAIAL